MVKPRKSMMASTNNNSENKRRIVYDYNIGGMLLIFLGRSDQGAKLNSPTGLFPIEAYNKTRRILKT